jgi:hypothetical protein
MERKTMGWIFRKRVNLGRGAALNVSKSGVSVSKRVGPVTVNSRGRLTVRIAPGLTWRAGGSSGRRKSRPNLFE